MNIKDLIELLGWITVISFSVAILNFVVKYINKKYISKLGEDKKQIVTFYRKIMKLIIKCHKAAGTITVISVLAHFGIAVSSNRISITGIIAALIMISIFALGFYGAFINKNYKGKWLKVHKVLALLLIIAIGIHVL
ncbi:hypothetical protein [Clostridium vincentii]|uniref:Cytochrome b561 bacterial/Ni-hydrogenase domain-containing protein n=1 Tax=Clostridium vincentii TaxID=52704 RepID=A0A2T0B918_9CLOT|nr:hypothetical protein [Clostridium vincentii]PRR80380.1 hypothetical protein CLVI_30670 [Clostridium vincentii]